MPDEVWHHTSGHMGLLCLPARLTQATTATMKLLYDGASLKTLKLAQMPTPESSAFQEKVGGGFLPYLSSVLRASNAIRGISNTAYKNGRF